MGVMYACNEGCLYVTCAASVSHIHVILLTILTLGAGGRFDSHFWTQSGAPSPYLAFRAPPAFKLYMVLKACPAFNPYLAFRAPPSRFQAIYGVESVPRSALSLKMGVKAPPALDLKFWFRAGAALQSTVR